MCAIVVVCFCTFLTAPRGVYLLYQDTFFTLDYTHCLFGGRAGHLKRGLVTVFNPFATSVFS